MPRQASIGVAAFWLMLVATPVRAAPDGTTSGDEVDQRWSQADGWFADLPAGMLATVSTDQERHGVTAYERQKASDCPKGAKAPACEAKGSKTAFGMNLLHVRLEAAKKARDDGKKPLCFKLAYAAAATAAGLPAFRAQSLKKRAWKPGVSYATRWDGTLTEDEVFAKAASALNEARRLYDTCGGPKPFAGFPDPNTDYTRKDALLAGSLILQRMQSFDFGEPYGRAGKITRPQPVANNAGGDDRGDEGAADDPAPAAKKEPKKRCVKSGGRCGGDYGECCGGTGTCVTITAKNADICM